MASRELQGWQPDPFGLHEMRYFSVGRPTKLVRDGRVDAYDEPPDEQSSGSAANGAQAVPVAAETAVSSGTQLPAAALPGIAISAATASAATPSGPGPSGAAPPTDAPAITMSTTAMSTTATPVQSDAAAPTRVFAPVQTDPPVSPVPGRPVARPQRRWIEYAFVAGGAVVAVIVFVALVGGGSGKSGLTPAAFVTKAAQRTLAQNTADFTMSATVSAAGQTMAMGGNGQIDLEHDAMSFNAGASTSSGSITENELEVGGNRYVKVAVNGKSLPLSGGREWIETPFAPTTAGQSFTTVSPESSLALLTREGARVTSLGSQSIGGQNCNGYSVTPSSQAMVAAARQEFAKLGVSAADTTAALQALQNVQPPTVTAWFSSRTGLACQLTFAMQFGAPTSSQSTGVQAQLTFTHYGARVTIAPPAASDTVSIQQFLQSTTHV